MPEMNSIMGSHGMTAPAPKIARICELSVDIVVQDP
jgi:hypothetical protein